MRPSKPALPEWARPQDLAPTVENARRLGLPQAARPEAQHASPAPATTQQPAEPSWGQRLNRNMRQWGEGVIDRLDEAAVADGGGLVTALAALARTPARSFTSFMQGTAGTVSLLDGRVRGEISDGLSQVMSDPGLIGRAASDYWRSRTLTDMAADLYANGAAGAMMGGAGAAALGRLNRLPGLEALADAVANAKPATARLRQTGAVGDLSGSVPYGLPRPGLLVPQGLSPATFDRMSATVRRTAAEMGLGDDIYVMGSRAGGTATATSDIDIAIRVSPAQFDMLIERAFARARGSALNTRATAIERGRIHTGEAGLRGLRDQIEAQTGFRAQVSVIRAGSMFDNGPQTPLAFTFKRK